MPARSRYGAVDPRDPEAAGRCDRGGEIRKHSELLTEYRWAGNRLVPTGFLCCAEHIDPPQPQDRIVILQPDPRPVIDPRPNIDLQASTFLSLLLENGAQFITEGGVLLVIESGDNPGNNVLQTQSLEWIFTQDDEPVYVE